MVVVNIVARDWVELKRKDRKRRVLLVFIYLGVDSSSSTSLMYCPRPHRPLLAVQTAWSHRDRAQSDLLSRNFHLYDWHGAIDKTITTGVSYSSPSNSCLKLSRFQSPGSVPSRGNCATTTKRRITPSSLYFLTRKATCSVPYPPLRR